MDMRLRGDRDGADTARAIHETVNSRVIFIAGSKEPTTLERIALAEPWAILFKPVSHRQFQNAIEGALAD